MSEEVATLSGPAAEDSLGTTLMHEHLFVIDTEYRNAYPGSWNEDLEVQWAIARLTEAYERGVRTIVDATVLGLGRRLSSMRKVAAASPVKIIAATGLYSYDDVPLAFRTDRDPLGDVDLLTDLFVREIRSGIGESDVRAGVLKATTDKHGITPGVERALVATAAAHVETGAAVITHTNVRALPGSGLSQAELLIKQGVAPERIVIGHSDDSNDLEYLRRLAQTGCYVGFDHLNTVVQSPTIAERIDNVCKLLEEGYIGQIVLSHDACCFAERYGHSMSMTMVHDLVVPSLRRRGVSEAEIDIVLVQNPRKVLVGSPS